MLQIVNRLQEKASFLQKFPGGACPRTRLESGAFGAGSIFSASYAYIVP